MAISRVPEPQSRARLSGQIPLSPPAWNGAVRLSRRGQMPEWRTSRVTGAGASWGWRRRTRRRPARPAHPQRCGLRVLAAAPAPPGRAPRISSAAAA